MEERMLGHTPYLVRLSHGSGAPILAIHGALTGAWYFEEAIPFCVSHGHSVYAITLPGHDPASIPTISTTTMSDATTAVHAMVEHIHRTHGVMPILWGHSMGGYIAQVVASVYEKAGHPLSGLLLSHSAPTDGLWRDLFTIRIFDTSPWRNIAWGIWAYIMRNPLVPQAAYLARLVSPHGSTDKGALLQKRLVPASALMIQSILCGHPSPIALTQTPIVIIAGQQDPLITPRTTERIARSLGLSSKDILYTSGGHMHLFEPEWQETIALALSRLTSLDAAHTS